jgi:hypothetical protein
MYNLDKKCTNSQKQSLASDLDPKVFHCAVELKDSSSSLQHTLRGQRYLLVGL